jgi:hypothetical protein
MAALTKAESRVHPFPCLGGLQHHGRDILSARVVGCSPWESGIEPAAAEFFFRCHRIQSCYPATNEELTRRDWLTIQIADEKSHGAFRVGEQRGGWRVERAHCRIGRLPVCCEHGGRVGDLLKRLHTTDDEIIGRVQLSRQVAQFQDHPQFGLGRDQTMAPQTIFEIERPRSRSNPPRERAASSAEIANSFRDLPVCIGLAQSRASNLVECV